MKTGVIKRLAMRIKTIVATLRRDEHFVNVDEENDWNEESEVMITDSLHDEDILRDNLHNERLEAALAELVARAPPCHSVTRLTFLCHEFMTEEGRSVSFYSSCQPAAAQIS